MTRLITICVLLCAATFNCPAQLQLLPAGALRINAPAPSQLVAVDVSHDLINWKMMTNVAPSAGQITFANNPEQSDPARFFRTADADDTFTIAGYVDGGDYFGGIAGATITESLAGTSVKSDAYGFFHFNQRFARTNLPITLTTTAAYLDRVERTIFEGTASTFAAIRLNIAPPHLLPPISDRPYHFKVAGGSRAGLEYFVQFQPHPNGISGLVTITGGITGEGTFYTRLGLPTAYGLNLGSAPGHEAEIVFWPSFVAGAERAGYFSGIPSTNGALSGNGIVIWQHYTNAPQTLNGLAFQIGEDHIQFTNTLYRLVRNNIVEEGRFEGTREDSAWHVSLIKLDSVLARSAIDLAFVSPTNGTFVLTIHGEQSVSGAMRTIPYVVPQSPGVPGIPPSKIHFTAGPNGGLGAGTQYTAFFSGGATGTFTTQFPSGDPYSRGVYSYTTNGANAHLRMTYPEFGDDYDDIELIFRAPAGSPSPSDFSGTQLILGTVYPFNGTFTYE